MKFRYIIERIPNSKLTKVRVLDNKTRNTIYESDSGDCYRYCLATRAMRLDK